MRAARYSRRQMRSGPLVLVNRQHPLAEEPRQLLTAADERYPNILLERQAARLLAACIQAAGGAREIVPVSGWRSQAEQQGIWEDALQRRGEAFTRQYVAGPTRRSSDLTSSGPIFRRKAPAGGSGDWRPGTASSSGTTGKRSP